MPFLTKKQSKELREKRKNIMKKNIIISIISIVFFYNFMFYWL